MDKTIQDEDRFLSWKTVLFSTVSALTLYYLIGFSFLPSQFSLIDLSVFELIYFLLIDQFLIEGLYIALLLKGMELYKRGMQIRIALEKEKLLSFELLKFIPFFGLIFFFINPITQTLRYIVRNGFEFERAVFLNEYLFNPSLYVIYLVFGTIIGISVILLKVFNIHPHSPDEVLTRLVGEHQAVMKPFQVEDTYWFEVDRRKYKAITASKELRIQKNLSQLESELDENVFVRINRAIIINTKFIESYSPWKNSSYLIEMKTPHRKEFSVSRNRVKEFKRVMKI